MGEIEEIIASAPWRFAKTMPHMPHEYVVEGKTLDPASFDALAAHITEEGFKAEWRGRTNTYLEHDGFRLLGATRSRRRVDQDHKSREAARAAVEETRPGSAGLS